MSYVKLREMTVPEIEADGKFTPRRRYQKSPTQSVFAETSGECRLFVMLPEHLEAHASSRVKDKKTGEERFVIYGTSVQELERAWREIGAKYRKSLAVDVLAPMISILIERDTYGRSSTESELSPALKFEAERYLKNSRETLDRHDRPDDYKWEDDGVGRSRRGTRYTDGESAHHEIPYDEEVWNRLVELSARMEAGQKMLEKLVKSGDIVKRLMAPAGLQLTGPSQGDKS